MNISQVISGCKKNDRKSQKYLYTTYGPKFLSICRRYMKAEMDAEDALVQGFYKIYSKIDQYSGSGNFEGWMRRVVVNECLMMLRKKTNFMMQVEINNIEVEDPITVEDDLAYQELVQLLDLLPTGYRTVFNLYVIEGYKHREIAEILNISINTSKSQLILAKKRMREIIKKKHKAYVS